MARSGYAKIIGEKTSDIKGSVKQKGHEDWIEVISMDHTILTPVDKQTGQVFGRRQHQPLVLVKPTDKATPLIYKVMCSGENLSKVTIDFLKVDKTGVEVNHYSIELEEAKVIQVRTLLPDTKTEELTNRPMTEEVSLSYRKVTWIYHDGGIMHSDDWHDRTA